MTLKCCSDPEVEYVKFDHGSYFYYAFQCSCSRIVSVVTDKIWKKS